MIEVHIEKYEMDRLLNRFETAPRVIREAKKEAYRTAANKLVETVRRKIGGTGKVQGWQVPDTGKYTGYAKAWPRKREDNGWTEPSKNGRQWPVGHVTNAINSGHKFRRPSGVQGYQPRIKSGRQNVPGKRFYQAAEAQLPFIANAAAKEVLAAAKKHLEG